MKIKLPYMWDERESLLAKRYNKKAASDNTNKKSNITLAIDSETANALRHISEGEGLSMNSKINSVLWKYTSFYKYVEQDGSLIIPSRSVNFFIDNIDEDKWIQEYSDTLEEIIPFFFLELKTPATLEHSLKLIFDRLLAYGGSYKACSYHMDNHGGYLNLVFRHKYGIKWSRILSTVYTRLINRTLNEPAQCLNIAEKWFAIKIPAKN